MSLKISIISVCYNMAEYIEQTIQSVLSQTYDNVEYIVIDGGSTDGTIDIIHKYTESISIFVSEPDEGQYDAINKGFKLATGDVIAWLNADDIYFPWTCSVVASFFSEYENENWIIGSYSYIDDQGNPLFFQKKNGAKPRNYIANGWFNASLFGYLQQESMFWRKEVLGSCGMLNTEYSLAADFELWKRFAQHYNLVSLDVPLAGFRVRLDCRSKQLHAQYCAEVKMINRSSKAPSLIMKMAGNSKHFNHLLRLLTFRKSRIYYYSFIGMRHYLKNKTRSIGNYTLSQLIYYR